MYGELAGWWPLLSAPAVYAEEAEIYRRLLTGAGDRPPRRSWSWARAGATTPSTSRPTSGSPWSTCPRACWRSAASSTRSSSTSGRHAGGPPRPEFDAVFVHDAIAYMTTEDDLRKVMETAFVHCRPGGAALFARPPAGELPHRHRLGRPRRRRAGRPLPGVDLGPRPARHHLHRRLRLPAARGRRLGPRRPRPPRRGPVPTGDLAAAAGRDRLRRHGGPGRPLGLEPGSYELLVATRRASQST